MLTLAVGLLAAGVVVLLVSVSTGSSTEPSTGNRDAVEQPETTPPTSPADSAPGGDQTANPNGPGAPASEHSTAGGDQTTNPNGVGAPASEHSTGGEP